MHCHRGCAVCLGNLRNLHRVDVFLIKALTELNRHRLFLAFHQGTHDFSDQFGRFHQTRAFPVFHDFRRRASHVHINDINGILLDFLRHCPQNFGVGAEQLHRNRAFLRIHLKQLRCVFIII